jgi:tetratricopeptide (TPR) repeat protein
LVEMRDEVLGRVIAAPDDVEAIDALVRIQRILAADNPEALRSKAIEYARAAAAGLQTEEHYTVQAMRLLVLVNLLAATQAETDGLAPGHTQAAGHVMAEGERPAAARAARFPALAHSRAAALSAVTASAFKREYFLVLSPPRPVDRAQHEVGALSIAGFSALLRRTGDGFVQVQVGAFASQANAEALAARVRQRGLTVSVVAGRAGTAFEPVRPLRSPAASPRPASRAQSFDDLMERGVRLYGPGLYGPALASFRQAARIRPDSARAHLWWGRAAFKVLRHREARGALLRALALSRDAEVARQAHLLLRAMREPNAVSTAPGTD